MLLIRGLLSLFNVFKGTGLVGALERAHERKLKAANDQDKLAAELDIERIGGAISMAEIRAGDRWGASSIGCYLIVIPYGLWFAAIILDSVIDASWSILALPPQIHSMVTVLIPAILIGDAAKSFNRVRAR